MGAYICRGGKKSGYAGYYFHLEPTTNNNFIIAGLHMPDNVVLQSVREEILDSGADIAEAINMAQGFELDLDTQMKRTPMGFAQGSEFDYMLRLKDFCLVQPIDNKFLFDKQLTQNTLAEFIKCKPFLDIINRAVQYAKEEMY